MTSQLDITNEGQKVSPFPAGYGYPHSNALLQSRLKLERCKPHIAARHPTKCDVINDVKLFPTVYRRIYFRKFLTLSNQTSHYKSKCIRIPNKPQLLMSADNLCNQFGPRSGLTDCPNCFDIDCVPEGFFEKMFSKRVSRLHQMKNYPSCRVKTCRLALNLVCGGSSILAQKLVHLRSRHNKRHLNHDLRFPTMWYVGPAKAQTSLPACTYAQTDQSIC